MIPTKDELLKAFNKQAPAEPSKDELLSAFKKKDVPSASDTGSSSNGSPTPSPSNGVSQSDSQTGQPRISPDSFDQQPTPGIPTIPQIDFNHPDPIAQAVVPMQLERDQLIQRNASADATSHKQVFIPGGPPTSQVQEMNKKISDVVSSAFPSVQSAKSYLVTQLAKKGVTVKGTTPEDVVTGKSEPLTPQNFDQLSTDDLRSAIDQNNLTEKVALGKVAKGIDIQQAFGSSGSFEEGALKFEGKQSKNISGMIQRLGGATDQIPNALSGAIVHKALNDPDVLEAVKQSPQMEQQWKEASDNLYVNHPDFAKNYVSQLLSQERENRGMNNTVVNVPTSGAMDDLVKTLVGEGKMGPKEVDVYQKQIRPMLGVWNSIGRGIGRLVVPALVNESPIKTPGILESGEDEYVSQIRNVAHSIEDFSDMAEQATIGTKWGDDQKRALELAQHDYTQVSLNPKNVFHAASQAGGTIVGFMAPMIMGGEIGSAAGISRGAATDLTNMIMFESVNKDEAVRTLTNPDAQFAYTVLGTAGDTFLGKFFHSGETADAARNALKGDIMQTVKDFTDQKITAAAAKQTILNRAKSIITAVGEQGPTLLKDQAEIGGVMSAFQLLHSGLNAAFGDRDTTLDKTAADVFNAFKTGFLGSAVLSGVKAMAITPRMNGTILSELGANPEFFKKVIEDGAKLSPEMDATKNERIANLNAASKIYNELSDIDIPDQKKADYLVKAMGQNIWERKAEATSDDVLKAQYESKANEARLAKESILKIPDTVPVHDETLTSIEAATTEWKKNISEIDSRTDIPDTQKQSLKQDEDAKHAQIISDLMKSRLAPKAEVNAPAAETQQSTVTNIPEEFTKAKADIEAKRTEDVNDALKRSVSLDFIPDENFVKSENGRKYRTQQNEIRKKLNLLQKLKICE